MNLSDEGVLGIFKDKKFSHDQCIWHTNSFSKKTNKYKLVFEQNAQILILNQDKKAIWKPKVNPGEAPYELRLQDDGNLVIYDKNNQPLYSADCYR